MKEVYGNNSTTEEHRPGNLKTHSNWGTRFFLGTLFAVLVWFWWLLIYSGGVGGHHG
ncbi:MAG: hypothetical protein V3S33_03400 [Gammaproteobacteria bacterium]